MKPTKRFGPFEVDLQSGELRRNGGRIRIQDQPYQILELLLERPGELVSREELHEKLWPADTFVEFEHGLNAAVNRLRAALSDSAGKPRYIETVPKRGYRFVGSLHEPEKVTGSKFVPAGAAKVWWAAVVLSASLMISAGLHFVFWRAGSGDKPELPLRKFTIPIEGIHVKHAAISPDGQRVAYFSSSRDFVDSSLWLYEIEKRQARLLGDGFTAGASLVWSPNGDSLGYSVGPRVETTSLSGGPARTMFAYPEGTQANAVWANSGRSLFVVAGNHLFESPPAGEPTRLSESAKLLHYPAVLPGAGKLLVTAGESGARDVLALDLVKGSQELVAHGERPPHVASGTDCKAAWSPSGHVVYESSGALWAVPFSPESLQTTGQPFVIRASGRNPSVALDGTLVYLFEDVGLRQLVWRDRQGREVGLISQPQELLAMPVLSPEESRVASLGAENGEREIWIHDLLHRHNRRVTFDPAVADRPSWTPDGKGIVYSSWGRGMFRIAADGSGNPEPLHDSGYSHGWSPDEHYLIYESGGGILYLRSRHDGSGYEAVPFVTDEFDTHAPQLSPDGRFVAYSSNESGEYQIYVQPFPDGGTKWMVSTGGGLAPRWRGDGQELFYLTRTDPPTLFAVSVTASPAISFGKSERLFSDLGFRGRSHTYDVSSDGQSFVMVKTVKETPKTEIRVAQNWYSEFRDHHGDRR